MTFYHHRNVQMYTGLLLCDWLVRSGEPLESPELSQVLHDRISIVDDILHGLPWRLNYRKINDNSEPVQTTDAPPIMWYVYIL